MPVNEACFQVPLSFTKFDLRDYLWNLYNVEVKKVRSLVQGQPLKRRFQGSNSAYRPKPLKYMTVVLEKPFQWPEVPTDLQPWNNELWKKRQEQQDADNQRQYDRQKAKGVMKSQEPLSSERMKLANLAKEMMQGHVKWENNVELDPRWDKILEKEREDAANGKVANGVTKKN